MDCRIQKKDCRMLFSDQMSHCAPLCGAMSTVAWTVIARLSLISMSVRITRMILMQVARCGSPALLFSMRTQTLSDGERVL